MEASSQRMDELQREVLDLHQTKMKWEMERERLMAEVTRERRRREKEAYRRKVAEECIEKLDEEMKNLQQVQHRRLQTRLECCVTMISNTKKMQLTTSPCDCSRSEQI